MRNRITNALLNRYESIMIDLVNGDYAANAYGISESFEKELEDYSSSGISIELSPEQKVQLVKTMFSNLKASIGHSLESLHKEITREF